MFAPTIKHAISGIDNADALTSAFETLVRGELSETIGNADYGTAADTRKVAWFGLTLRYRMGGKWHNIATTPLVSATRNDGDGNPLPYIPTRHHFSKVLNVSKPTDNTLAHFAFAAPSDTDVKKGRTVSMGGKVYRTNASGNIVTARGDLRVLFRNAYGESITAKFAAILAQSSTPWADPAKARNLEIVLECRDTVETR